MDQRVALIADWLRDEWTLTELAERYGVSRKTGYKWIARYTADRAHGLADRSRAPQLAVWWLRLGIQLDWIDPAHPEQNGRHGRFHLTLQQDTASARRETGQIKWQGKLVFMSEAVRADSTAPRVASPRRGTIDRWDRQTGKVLPMFPVEQVPLPSPLSPLPSPLSPLPYSGRCGSM